MIVDHDPGDEDDGGTRPEIEWRFVQGECIIVFAARELPSLPDQDPGDEQPRLEAIWPSWFDPGPPPARDAIAVDVRRAA